MRQGKIDEGKATLRMKMDMKSDNPVMRDLVAYRIKFLPHPHVGGDTTLQPSVDWDQTSGASIPPTTTPIASLIPWRMSLTRCALWNLDHEESRTCGFWMTLASTSLLSGSVELELDWTDPPRSSAG